MRAFFAAPGWRCGASAAHASSVASGRSVLGSGTIEARPAARARARLQLRATDDAAGAPPEDPSVTYASALRLSIALVFGFVVYVAVAGTLLLVGPAYAPPGSPIHYQVGVGIVAGIAVTIELYRRMELRRRRA